MNIKFVIFNSNQVKELYKISIRALLNSDTGSSIQKQKKRILDTKQNKIYNFHPILSEGIRRVKSSIIMILVGPISPAVRSSVGRRPSQFKAPSNIFCKKNSIQHQLLSYTVMILKISFLIAHFVLFFDCSTHHKVLGKLLICGIRKHRFGWRCFSSKSNDI